jgi:aconitate hydratase
MLVPPLPVDEARRVELLKGQNIISLPEFDPIPDSLEIPVLLKVGDNVSTDEILPAGARVLPFRSNIPRISEFAFDVVDASYSRRARELQERAGHAVVGGVNYGQGSSREHAALAPRYLGLRVVIAKSFARIHRQNLINFGVLPLVFSDESSFDQIEQGDVLRIIGLHTQLGQGVQVTVENLTRRGSLDTQHDLSARQQNVLLAGGIINWIKTQR